MKIESIHIEVAKLIWEGDLTLLQIATQKGITERTISNWKNQPNFAKILQDMEDEHKNAAKRESIRWARRSVKTLVKLQDIAASWTDEHGKVWPEEFKFGADVARKAAVDLLEMAGVKPVEVEGNVGGTLTLRILREDAKPNSGLEA